EDGIRDRNVTGVQTCALPISEPLGRCPPGNCRVTPRTLAPRREVDAFLHGGLRALPRLALDWGNSWSAERLDDAQYISRSHLHRSEERRVGKEWRAWVERIG